MFQATVDFLENIVRFFSDEQFASIVAVAKIVFVLAGALFLFLILFLSWKSGYFKTKLTSYNWYFKNLDKIAEAEAEAKEKEITEDEAETIKRDSER